MRAAVLSHFWQVETVLLDCGELPAIDAEVAVICGAIEAEGKQKLVEQVRQAQPLMLIVRSNGFDSGPLAGADATVDEDPGPGPLVSTIYQLLTERGMPSRAWPIEGEAEWLR